MMSVDIVTAGPVAASQPGRSARLQAKIEFLLPTFYQVTARLWAAPGLRQRYPAYLVLMHQLVRATVPLMRAAIGRCDELGDADAVATGVGRYLRQHIREEAGHDDWVRADLGVIQPDADRLLAAMPPPAVASVVGSQYYWIAHHHPVTLLGHIAVLEGYPPAAELADRLAAASGLPGPAFRTLRKHAVLDQRHRDQLFTVIDALPLTDADEAAVGVSALHTIAQLIPAVEALSEPAAAASHDQPGRRS